ncbi:MAG: hypothetical protein V3W34_11765, partial [Phycisphaerae bacterium]
MKQSFLQVLGVVLVLAGCVTAWADPSPTAETILEQVEARGTKIQDLRCTVIFTEEDLITEDVTRREGEIRFKRKEPNPVFMISFDKLIQDGEVIRKKSWYLFDGRYFYEALERSKSIIKRDVAPPGTVIDLFSIDKAPFPSPFGQKKDDILRHFDARLGPVNGKGPPD